MSSANYTANLLVQQAMQLFSAQAHLTASQMRLMLMPFQPWLDATWGMWDRNPATFQIQGVRQLLQLHPVFASVADRAPDTINFQWGAGELKAKDPNFDEVTLPYSVARPHRNLTAAAFNAKLQFTRHKKANFMHLVKGAMISNVMKGAEEDLLRFKPTGVESKGVKYIVAPRSGHYATLVASAIQANLDAGYTVYVNDIHDASQTPKTDEEYGMDQQARDKKDAIEKIWKLEKEAPDVVAICQGGIPTAIAIAKLCKDKSPFKPKTWAFFSGPGDVSVTASKVSQFGQDMSRFFLETQAVTRVPFFMPGAGKEVRAGHDQGNGFMAGNLGRHLNDLAWLMNAIASRGKEWVDHIPLEQKDIIDKLDDENLDDLERAFLNELLFRTEYNTFADHPGKSFKDAIIEDFQGNFLASDTATYFGEPVSLKDIDIPTLTADAEKDDISSIGQSMGILQHMKKGIIKAALIIPNKGHFWWAGKTAAQIHWPRIIDWQSNPEASDIPKFKQSMITDAQATHEANVIADKEKLEKSKPFQMKVIAGGLETPIGMPVNLVSNGPMARAA